MSSYSRVVRREYPFPQADRPDRVLEVLDAVCRGPLDDAKLGQEFGIHPRQGRYYADAAGYLGLVRFSGGYWRPERKGAELNSLADDDARYRIVGDIVVELPVFRDVARHLAMSGQLPSVEDVEEWIQGEDPKLNHETANRRAQTVLSWISNVSENSPEVIADLAPAHVSVPGLGGHRVAA